MGEDITCGCEEKHQGHICVLRGKGLTRRIKELTSRPNVVCLACGAEANSEDDVCSPVPLFI
ncbi:MAG TPA: hypothetical protein VI298_14555 [Geobacteraceae bacterium]